jgi:hypothetical protein
MTDPNAIPVIPLSAFVAKRGDSAQVLADIISIVEKAPESKWAAIEEKRAAFLSAYAQIYGSMPQDNNL